MSRLQTYTSVVPFKHLGILFEAGTVFETEGNRHPETGCMIFKQPDVDSNGRKCSGTICFDDDSVRKCVKGET